MLKSSWFISNRFTKIKQNEKLYTWIYVISILTISLSMVALLSVTTITQSLHNLISSKMGEKYPYVEAHGFSEVHDIKSGMGKNVVLKNNLIISRKGQDFVLKIFAVQKRKKNNIDVVNKNISKLAGSSIIISQSIAELLGVSIGDRVLLSSGSFKNLKDISQYMLTVIDIMDNNYQVQGIIPIEEVLKIDEKNWKTISIYEPKEVLNPDILLKELLENNINRNKVVVWYDKIPSLYEAMKLEKVSIYAIFSILLLISSFTIFATIASLGIKRKKDVAILRMLGVRRKQIFLIFMLQGVKIFLLTSFFGIFISFLIIENINDILNLTGSVVGLDISDLLSFEKTKEMNWEISLDSLLVLKILILNFIIGIFASIIPSYIIAKMEAGDVVKYD